jgi:hemoglobin
VTAGAGPTRAGTLTRDLDSRPQIEEMVRDFYRQVAMDDLLGPVFSEARVDWSVHIPKLVDFWEWQLLGAPATGRNPLRAHEPIHARRPFTPAMYDRWVAMFCSTVDEGFAGPVAEVAKARARRMARALERLLAGDHGPGSAPVEPLVRRRRAD